MGSLWVGAQGSCGPVDGEPYMARLNHEELDAGERCSSAHNALVLSSGAVVWDFGRSDDVEHE